MVNYQEVEQHFIAENPDQLQLLAPKIIELADSSKIWKFEGEMGAGKTSLIKAICLEKGVAEHVTSPTYSLVHEYRDVNEQTIYHFDFYRLETIAEAIEIGCLEYFDSGDICLIEWPELIAPMLPEDAITIRIEVRENSSRSIKIIRNG